MKLSRFFRLLLLASLPAWGGCGVKGDPIPYVVAYPPKAAQPAVPGQPAQKSTPAPTSPTDKGGQR